jgi:small conductance mechanosensitive channel
MDVNEIIRWVTKTGLTLVIGAVVLLVVYRILLRAIHRMVPSVLHAQAAHVPAGSSSSAEIDKRISTIEDLLTRLLRVVLLALLVALVLVVFDLWSILAGIVVIIVAITFASQDVVLDYVMGFLILVEGPYFKGDWVTIGTTGVQGEVEEIGLRRTLLRDGFGSSNAVSNGLIRMSQNGTRVFSVATVDLPVLQAHDLDAAIEVVARVSRELREDPQWTPQIPSDAGQDIWVTGITVDGAALRVQQRVVTGAGSPVASELRRRLVAALTAASIGTGRWDTPLPIATDAAAHKPRSA